MAGRPRTTSFPPEPPSSRPSLVLFWLLLVTVTGCQSLIGDDCNRNRDCSQTGDRICDTSQPGGYCTQFNCDPDSCPGEALCVAFGNTPSTVDGCGNLGRTSPYVRNFCMRRCKKDEQCRDGYVCMDLSEENPWGAEIISSNPKTSSVCVLSPGADKPEDDRLQDLAENVCFGSGVGFGGAAGAPSL